KAQFKYADKLGARYVVTLGPDELAAGKAQVRDMATHATESINMDMLGEYLCQLI
ncbi:MAG: His/Gly/Thr/Pro-type tRNA ligase C-terminal domain-containing protein, partial [Clostridia bacterium]|nr:His/Gly/Thr/Pro-type tRNA ligase C-terminal domain-containing protein [Clostridia bacterium]